MTITLNQPIATLHRIAKRVERPLKRLGVTTVRGLLGYFPVRHEDLRLVTPIRDVRIGARVVIRGRLAMIANRRSPRRHMLLTEALLTDATGSIRCVWFQQPYLAHVFASGMDVVVVGTATSDAFGFTLASPIIEAWREDAANACRIVPIYALTSGLTQKQIRFLVRMALPATRDLTEAIPDDIRVREGLIDHATAIREIHFPSSLEALVRARDRLAFEEALEYFRRVRAARAELSGASAPVVHAEDGFLEEFAARLPFQFTACQERAVREILRDMSSGQALGPHRPTPPLRVCTRTPYTDVPPPPAPPLQEGESRSRSPFEKGGEPLPAGEGTMKKNFSLRDEENNVRPMQRLLNGDVGSGKTVVAAIAAAAVARSGMQAAYLAPTEILAKQQAESFRRWLEPFSVRVALWTRMEQRLDGEAVSARAMGAVVRSGAVGVVIGTHALLAPRVQFSNLALAIIDEQHRFGVEQRAALRSKADSRKPIADSKPMPHLLSMTATPIPRTFALSLLGDLAVSVLDELPRNRKPLRTIVVPPADRLAMTRAVREELATGHQAFIVCPKIDVGEGDDIAAVTEAFERARAAFPGIAIGLLHGRLATKETKEVMDAFARRELMVLVATTVIEVGIDQPNATVIIIENAERFGLAQLHQLRGRVGRGSAAGTCYLTTQQDAPSIMERLERVAACTDGFQLAELDFNERGPGAIIGSEQSGWPTFRFATMDTKLLQRAKAAAEECETVERIGERVHLE